MDAPITIEDLLGPVNEVEKKNAPRQVFIAGDREILRAGPRVSIVGSRKASGRALAIAARLAEFLAARGTVVVSGLAEGVDTAAHEAAIAAGGHTVAVLGTALDACFPARNRALQQLIMREHLALSQFPSGAASKPAHFPMRNRTMALLSNATVIVEAGEKSGSLHAGWETLRLGRRLYFVEELSRGRSLSWPSEMGRYGAELLALQDLERIFGTDLGMSPRKIVEVPS